MIELINKIAKAKVHLKTTKMQKSGRNTFSKYSYFTPEDVDKMVNEVCVKFGLVTMYSLIRDEFGKPEGILDVYDLDTGKSIKYRQITATPNIKATNESQQLGGAVTYNERYISMSVFGIKDNSLDFDATHNTPKKEYKTPSIKAAIDTSKTIGFSGDLFDKAVKFLKGDGKTIEGLRAGGYIISVDVEKELLKKVGK